MERAFAKGVSFAYGAISNTNKLLFGVLLTALPAQAETVTIAALGDSLTAGFGLAQGDGFVPQLQSWLVAEGADVQIINAGVSGDTTAGGLSRVAWTLTPEVDAMIVTLGGNDFLRGIDPQVSQANLDGILQAGDAAEIPMLLVGLEVSTNYGAEFKSAFEGMYPALAEKYAIPLFPDFAAGMRDAANGDLQAFLQADGIHPNAAGVQAIVAAIGPSVLELVAAAQ